MKVEFTKDEVELLISWAGDLPRTETDFPASLMTTEETPLVEVLRAALPSQDLSSPPDSEVEITLTQRQIVLILSWADEATKGYYSSLGSVTTLEEERLVGKLRTTCEGPAVAKPTHEFQATILMLSHRELQLIMSWADTATRGLYDVATPLMPPEEAVLADRLRASLESGECVTVDLSLPEIDLILYWMDRGTNDGHGSLKSGLAQDEHALLSKLHRVLGLGRAREARTDSTKPCLHIRKLLWLALACVVVDGLCLKAARGYDPPRLWLFFYAVVVMTLWFLSVALSARLSVMEMGNARSFLVAHSLVVLMIFVQFVVIVIGGAYVAATGTVGIR